MTASSTSVPTSPSSPPEPWQRLGSWSIDVAVVLIVAAVAAAIHGLASLIVVLVGAPAYYVGLVGVRGVGTLGHRAMGLVVIDQRSADRMGPQQAALRFSVVLLSVVPVGVPFIAGAARVVREQDRRAFHDLATQSYIIRSR